MTRDNPHGNSYGPAYTGRSGDGDAPIWIQQAADLSPFVGGPVLVRFEYLTDDATHEQGWAIDDIAISQLGFLDDVEIEGANWLAAGFARHTNVLPQSFLIQAILMGEDTVQVEQLQLDENRRGVWTLPLDGETDRAVLIVSATTPYTSQRAMYRYQIGR